MKSFPSTLQDEFKRNKFIAVDLVEIYMVTPNGQNDFIFLTNAGFNIQFNNNTYTAQGDYLGFSSVGEDFDVKVGKFSIFLTAINVALVNKLYGKDFEGRRVVIRKAFLDFDPMTLSIVDQPILIFDGIIYNIIITETATTASLQVECATLWADFERVKGRKTNNSSNHLFQRGLTRDTGFEQSGYVGNTEIKWGRV